ncbi:MAG: DUF4212 domain-containing protein [Rhodothermales bacterium]
MDRQTYWRRQIRRTVGLLLVWALVGFVMSILFVEELNAVSVLGIPFGFWMAQQGAIFVFIVLIFVYAYLSGKADEEAGVAE